jgi:hypothetical protein
MTGQCGDDWPLEAGMAILKRLWAVSLASFQLARQEQRRSARGVTLSGGPGAGIEIQQISGLSRSSRKAESGQELDPLLGPAAFPAILPEFQHLHFRDPLETVSYYVSRLLLLAIVMCHPCADEDFFAVQAGAPLAALADEACQPMSWHDGVMKMMMMCCSVPAVCFGIWPESVNRSMHR